MLDSLIARADNQIMALEILGVALGLSTFVDMLRGRVVRCWVDNAGGEAALLRGSARKIDHNRIVHGVWAFCLVNAIGLWIERVASDDNIADEPSREVYSTVDGLG